MRVGRRFGTSRHHAQRRGRRHRQQHLFETARDLWQQLQPLRLGNGLREEVALQRDVALARQQRELRRALDALGGDREAEAAAQLFSDLIGSQSAVFRKPVAEPGRNINLPTGEMEGRLNSRILPASFTVVDDPTQKEFRGKPLMGHFPVDLEGVAPQPVVVIEKGAFKNYLSTRTPTRDSKSSNGHARLPGSFGGYTAFASNLFVKSDETIPADGMKKKLIELIQQRNKPYGLLVKKLDFPSSATFEELRGVLGGQGSRPAPLPLLIYRVYPDGREELVRGLRFRGLNVRALKDIVAAGSDEAQFDYMANGAPFAVIGGGNYVFGCTTVAPSILFEDLELERPQVELPKLPVVPPPPMTV